MENQKTCYICKGSGIKVSRRYRREKIINDNLTPTCLTCKGVGYMKKSSRQREDGSFKTKISKSYPSFIANGPLPYGLNHKIYSELEYDEDLCYLVGEWKIFQKIHSHRYSTDDLVTSRTACQVSKLLNLEKMICLDIGCGIGSVLLSNAWQLVNSICFGIEIQTRRFELAKRSICYNVGPYPEEQSRVGVFNCDLRDVDQIIEFTHPYRYYDLITGTPPYFDPITQDSQPASLEAAGCLFELRGNIYDYCATASRLLRPPNTPSKSSDSDKNNSSPSIFVVCHAASRAAQVYAACLKFKLVILKRIDVIPKRKKRTLFCVFVITLETWINHKSIQSNYPSLNYLNITFDNLEERVNLANFLHDIESHEFSTTHLIAAAKNTKDKNNMYDNKNILKKPVYYVTGSVHGEKIESLCVREESGLHTTEYALLLQELSKPSSYNKEIYHIEKNA
jgi:tRNA1(Val) A37 N6-methylase TrmN6